MALKGLSPAKLASKPMEAVRADLPLNDAAVDPYAPVPVTEQAKISFGVNPELHRAWKLFAGEAGVTIQSLILESVNAYMSDSRNIERLKAAHKASRLVIKQARVAKNSR